MNVIPKRKPEVVWRLEKGKHEEAWAKARSDDDEDFEEIGVLTLMIKGGIHQLNLVGAEIWTRVDGVRSAKEIAAEVAALFGWEPQETEEAVEGFLGGLAERGWLTLSDGSGPGEEGR